LVRSGNVPDGQALLIMMRGKADLPFVQGDKEMVLLMRPTVVLPQDAGRGD
jgi:hypothetical protein